jgi:hypothetical protein
MHTDTNYKFEICFNTVLHLKETSEIVLTVASLTPVNGSKLGP